MSTLYLNKALSDLSGGDNWDISLSAAGPEAFGKRSVVAKRKTAQECAFTFEGEPGSTNWDGTWTVYAISKSKSGIDGYLDVKLTRVNSRGRAVETKDSVEGEQAISTYEVEYVFNFGDLTWSNPSALDRIRVDILLRNANTNTSLDFWTYGYSPGAQSSTRVICPAI